LAISLVLKQTIKIYYLIFFDNYAFSVPGSKQNPTHYTQTSFLYLTVNKYQTQNRFIVLLSLINLHRK